MTVDEPTFKDPFQFKTFSIEQENAPMKVGTDGVLLGAWTSFEGAKNILDIGTGTGVIALIAAHRNNKASIKGIEINEASFENCLINFSASPWSDRLNAIHSSIQDFTNSCEESFDTIICNPPFFTGGTMSNNADRNTVRHTIKLPNGDLLNCVRKLLSPKGRFNVILPTIEGYQFESMAHRYGIFSRTLVEVRPKKDKPVERLLMSFSKEKGITETKELVIQNEKRNDYTAAYRALTEDLYTIF